VPSKDPIQKFTDILERISEPASKLGPQAEDLCPEIPWAQIRGVGNRLRHEYDRISSPRICSVLRIALTFKPVPF
jgi:uncharacterized protein with HEPN domain